MLDWKIFRKPQRYLGNEWNVIKKSHHRKIKICLCYPDLYELGMSNLGMRIIYSQLNTFPDVVCERAFMPDEDLHMYLKEHKKRLFSLETKTDLCNFEIVGFNLNYELNYTNFLTMLSLGGLEIKTHDRKDVIILGGSIANPESLAEFVDVFFLGEFEEVANQFIEVLRKYKAKEERLRALAELDGFYIPKFYNVYPKGNIYIYERQYKYAKLPIKKVYVKDLNTSFFPTRWLTTLTEIVHDRAQIEIARGCPNKCFFCQARCLYFPYRERKLSCITDLMKKTYESSGYENFSLLALSASDYSEIETLIDEVTEHFMNKKVGVSLPSLRVEDIVGELYRSLTKIKRISATFAIEAATHFLREKINKNIDVNKLFEAARILKSLHFRHVKLYFMFGFPQEEDSDLTAIGEFVKELKKKSDLKINLSINAFIPKPFSYFENVKMDNEDTLQRKRSLILSSIPKDRGIKVYISHAKRSILEGLISRADRSFSKVIYEAFLLGVRFDSYRERFNFKVWDHVLKRYDIDTGHCLDGRDNFSWSHIQVK